MITIFAKRAFLNTSPGVEFVSKEKSYKGHGHLQRVSSMIRADQIATEIGAKLNPQRGYKDDVCVYIKPHVRPGEDFRFEGSKSYIDIVDGWGLLPLLEKHPEVGVIACSKQDQEKLSKVLPQEILFIPQHHCNFERVRRNRRKITTVGVIGTEDAFPLLPTHLEEELAKRGVKLLKYSKFFSRQDIINFYKQIDIQIVWRPYRMRLSNPLKIVNASSFGIPTIAYREDVFKEIEGCYIPVEDLEEFLLNLDRLIADPLMYKMFSRDCIKKSEEYHIEKVGRMYKKL